MIFSFLFGIFIGLGFGFIRCEQILTRESKKFLDLKATYLRDTDDMNQTNIGDGGIE